MLPQLVKEAEEHHRDTIRITVRDWGVGIQGAPSGSGLGARLTQAFIAQLGGNVTVAAADPGTSVSLTTPLQDA